jgi:hypothetical protein
VAHATAPTPNNPKTPSTAALLEKTDDFFNGPNMIGDSSFDPTLVERTMPTTWPETAPEGIDDEDANLPS